MKMKIWLVVVVSMMMVQLEEKVVLAQGRKDQQLIETTCKNTPDYQLCMAVIRADPKSSAAAVPDLALIVVAEIKKKTGEILTAIKQHSKTGPKEMQPALKNCLNYYNAVMVGDVPVAEQATRGNPKFAETAMADTTIEATMCQNAFQKLKKPMPSPFTKQNKYIADVAAVARAIIRNLL